MTFIPAAQFADIFGSLFCFGLFVLVIAAGVWTTVREARLKAGEETPLDKVPPEMLRAAKRLVPDLDVAKVIVTYRKKNVPREYQFHGKGSGGKPIEVDVEPRGDQTGIHEVEVVYNPAYHKLEERREIELSNIPPAVTQAALDHLEAIGFPVQQLDRARTGKILGKEAFDLKGAWKNGRFEIKLLADGEVIKVELKIRRAT